MAGVLYIICIPTREEEARMRNNFTGSMPASCKVSDERLSNARNRSSDNNTNPSTPLTHRSETSNFQASLRMDSDYFLDETGGCCKCRHSISVPPSPVLRKTQTESQLKVGLNSGTTAADEGDGLRNAESAKRSKSMQFSTLLGRRGDPQPRKVLPKTELDLLPESPMEDVIRAMINSARVDNAVWTQGNSHKKWQIIFSVKAGLRSDNIVRILNDWGIGDRVGSFVSVLPCTQYKNAAENYTTENTAGSDDDHNTVPRYNAENEQKVENGWDRFLSSITARLNVAQIVEEVQRSADFTFDFIMLLIVASLVALFGLVENNSLFLAASMLISPLMGPIIAATFGTVIKDKKLQRFGVTNELLGIALVTAVGFVFGLIVCLVDSRFREGGSSTEEMMGRSLLHSVIVGIIVAIPSGIAVAIGILGENFGSLAGVAISASLLPPAVNSGLMFALAVIYKMFEADPLRFNNLIATTHYSNHQSVELAVMGLISMCVTLTNVICIYAMAVLFLKIKEVAGPSLPESKYRQFWRHDIKIARDYNRAHTAQEDQSSLRLTLENEIAGYEAQDSSLGAEIKRRLEQRFAANQTTWSPTTAAASLSLTHNYRDTTRRRTSIHDLFGQVNKNNNNNGQPTASLPTPMNPRLAAICNDQFAQNLRLSELVYRRAPIPAHHMPSQRVKVTPAMNCIHEQSPQPARGRRLDRLNSASSSNGATSVGRVETAMTTRKAHKFLVIPVRGEGHDDKPADADAKPHAAT